MALFRDLDSGYEIYQEAEPTAYYLHLFPNFSKGILRGEMVIEFAVSDETSHIILNATDLVIEKTVVTDLVMGTEIGSAYARDREHYYRLIIKTKSPLTPRKQYKVNIKYYSNRSMKSKTPYGFVWATRNYVEKMRNE